MRWNLVFGALIVSVGLCSQSFGFDLLDRMLGMGCGCDAQATCCEKPCGAAVAACDAKACGCAAATGCAAKACGCAAGNGCGCKKSCCKSHCGGLLGIFNHCGCGGCDSGCGCASKGCGCAAAASCGCAAAAPTCGCSAAAPTCGCGAAVESGSSDESAVPMPPAPMEDSSASLDGQRRIIQASSLIRN